MFREVRKEGRGAQGVQGGLGDQQGWPPSLTFGQSVAFPEEGCSDGEAAAAAAAAHGPPLVSKLLGAA